MGALSFILLILLNCAVFSLLFYIFRLPRAFDPKSRIAAAFLAGTAFFYVEFYIIAVKRMNFTASDLLFGMVAVVLFFPPFFFLGLFALGYFWAAFYGHKLAPNAAAYVLCILTVAAEFLFSWYASNQSL